jgi:CBS domain-containing protein
MQVRDIMSTPAITVATETPIREVARILRANQISGVPVVDGSGMLLGVITELDLIARNAPLHEPHYIAVLSALIPINLEEHRQYKEQLRRALAVNAHELMRTEVQTITPETDVREALELMLDPECAMLPVLDGNSLVGIITRTDLVQLIEELEMAPDDEEAEQESLS